MKSPFPGMDPYLEKHWRDVHASLIIYSRDRIQEQLPNSLRCRVEERVVLEDQVYPNVRVIERTPSNGTSSAAVGTALLEEPIYVHIPDESVTETYLEIVDGATGKKIITIIEFLSVTNKLTEANREQYVQKRKNARKAGVSFVEIDLLRQGERLVPFPPSSLPESHRSTYQVFVERGWEAHRVAVYRVPLRNVLPTIKIPLRPTDAEALLELQPLIDKCYANGRYEDLDYTHPSLPPLEKDDAEWAKELSRAAGRV